VQDTFPTVALIVVCSITVSLAGPFGTYNHVDLPTRLFYWLVNICSGIVVARTVRSFAGRLLTPLGAVLREAAVLVTITAILSPVIYLWTLFWLHPDQSGTFGFWPLAAIILVICVMVSVMRYCLPKMGHVGSMPEVAEPERTRLSRRLPKNVDQTVLRLTADGHVVHVITAHQQFELRMRFADAVEEMDLVQGHCTHRSHWVAQAAIAGTETVNGRPVLILCNGDRVPVSRKYQPGLEAAGIL